MLRLSRQSVSAIVRNSGGGGGGGVARSLNGNLINSLPISSSNPSLLDESKQILPTMSFFKSFVQTLKTAPRRTQHPQENLKPNIAILQAQGVPESIISRVRKGRPIKSLSKGLTKSGGRNSFGRTTIWHKGGGHKRLYRMIDFKRSKVDVSAIVERIEYDPNRTAFIALVKYEDDAVSYILAHSGMKVGDSVVSGENVEIKNGNCLSLKNIPIKTAIHNIEMTVGKGGQLARSAGASASIVRKDSEYAQLKLTSGEVRLVPLECRATIGSVSNQDLKNTTLGKAGRNRWLGVRPTVRGVAMNPIDHPHGGGEGRTSGGRHPVTPWGTPTKGHKTRHNKLTGKFILRRRPPNK